MKARQTVLHLTLHESMRLAKWYEKISWVMRQNHVAVAIIVFIEMLPRHVQVRFVRLVAFKLQQRHGADTKLSHLAGWMPNAEC